MSLAQDILSGSGRSISPKSPSKPKPSYLEMAKRKKKPVKQKTPGVSYRKEERKWLVHYYNGNKVIYLGLFYSQERAVLALRLYKLWVKQSYTDIPNKPVMRLYSRPKIEE